MSVADSERGHPRSQVWEVSLPYHMTYSVMYVMLPTPPPPAPDKHMPMKTSLPSGNTVAGDNEK